MKKISSCKWASITVFQFAYSLIVASMGIGILPLEAGRLNRENTSIWLGVYVAVCGVTQLICPIAGKLSDRLRHSKGRRRPCIAIGIALSSSAFAGMSLASYHLMPELYIALLFCAQLALNIVFSAQCAIPADLEENAIDAHDYKGVVSSFIGLYSFLGSLTACGTIVLSSVSPLYYEYLIYVLFLLLTCCVVWYSVSETSTKHLQVEPLTFKEVLKCYTISYSNDRNFFWVCVGRLFYYLSTSAVVFLYYYERDVFSLENAAVINRDLAVLIVSALLVGAVVTVPTANLSNKIGRKPVVYFACASVGLAFIGFMIVPDAHFVMIFSILFYGAGSGSYMSVDYALALECLPKSKKPAESFGLWGVAGFLGSAIGPLLGGWILSCNRTTVNGVEVYTILGYRELMFVLGVIMTCLVALSTHQIVGVK